MDRMELLKSKIITDFSLFVDEGLIYSYSYDKVIEKIQNLMNKYDIDYDIALDFGIHLKIKLNNNRFYFYNDIKKLLNVAGYYISNWKNTYEPFKIKKLNIDDIKNNNYLELILNKRYDFVDNSINIFLYHVSEKSKLDKILKQGLIPKSNNMIENHPDRIYLFNNVESCENFINEKNEILNINREDYIIFKVDMRLIKKIKLYKDSKFNDKYGALYTYDNIDPISLTIFNG
jgi:hypothetical protein